MFQRWKAMIDEATNTVCSFISVSFGDCQLTSHSDVSYIMFLRIIISHVKIYRVVSVRIQF